jgi:hypothetical protein
MGGIMIPPRRWVILRSVACCAAIVVTASGAQTPQKKIIHSLDEVPSFTYPIGSTAEQLLTSDAATFAGLTSKVRPDLELVFRDYDIQDHSAMLNLLLHKLDLQMLAGEDQEALKTCEQVPVFADQPDVKAMGCLNDTAFLKARIATGQSSGAAFDKEYERVLRSVVEPLPWNIVADRIKRRTARFEQLTPEYVKGRVEAEIEPSVRETHALDSKMAWRLIFWRGVMATEVPQRDIVLRVFSDYTQAHDK